MKIGRESCHRRPNGVAYVTPSDPHSVDPGRNSNSLILSYITNTHPTSSGLIINIWFNLKYYYNTWSTIIIYKDNYDHPRHGNQEYIFSCYTSNKIRIRIPNDPQNFRFLVNEHVIFFSLQVSHNLLDCNSMINSESV